MSTIYYALRFDMGDHDSEIWLALLSEWPFESFHEEDKVVTAYIQDHDIRQDLMHFITEREGVSYAHFELTKVPDKNWNEVWESSFNPVAVDDYCYIHAIFHKPVDKVFRHSVLISPKMAFGTGHHATTFMMLQAMSKLSFAGKQVLDYGCGTGILSVVAALEGAAGVLGVDIQPEAIENSIEHAELNHVSPLCRFVEGDLTCVGSGPFDIILANINTRIIVSTFDNMCSRLSPGGHILLSGVMSDHMHEIEKMLAKTTSSVAGLTPEIHQKEDWMQITLSFDPKPTDVV